jgi:replication factor C small subunit
MENAYEPWVEKYRPRKLSEIIGHEAIVKRLENFAKSRDLPHLLLAGRAGLGKTTAALALARELFGEDLPECFLEMNASDERRIGDVRGKIKDFARTLPLAKAPFKIILLDEADSLTQDAQQALRRTMEKYASNTRFILSCNYSSRIIEPIQSRCAVFRFVPLKDEEVKKILEHIIEKEGVKADEKALDAILLISRGDARKAINVLQGASALGKKVSEDDVFKVASRATPKEVKEMVELAAKGKFSEARKALEDLMLKYGMTGEDVLEQVYSIITSLDVSDRKKVELVDRLGEYDYRIGSGAGEKIQLEAMLAQIVLVCGGRE